MAKSGRTEGYQQLNRMNRNQGNIGEHPIVIQEKALQLVMRHIRDGAVLTAGYMTTKRGQFCLTLALVIGTQVVQSPSLEACAAGMGVVTAAHWLIDQSRQAGKGGSIAYNEQAINAIADDPDAIHGNWGE